MYEFRDIDLVLMDTELEFPRYIPPEISYWMGYVMFVPWISKSMSQDWAFLVFPIYMP